MLDKMLLPVRHRQVNSGGNMPLTIGGVAREAHVNVETVRYYQRRGLVAVPAVHPAGMRRYDEAAVKRIRFIKRAQALGFSLKEISGLLVLAEGRSCSDVCVAAERKLLEIERRIGELRQLLQKYQDRGQERPLRMTEGRIRREEEHLSAKLARIDAFRTVDPAQAMLSAGVIRVG